MINIVVAHGKVRSSWFQVHYSKSAPSFYLFSPCSIHRNATPEVLIPYVGTTIDRHPADDKISPQLAPSRLDIGELR